MKYSIDINADLGEGMSNDTELMNYISSCSIACGGHYGDEQTMRTAVRQAEDKGVKVGAHPSFPDKDNFGRKLITMTKEELKESIYHQLLQFYAVCETENVAVNHIKLHGALYNYAAIDAATADAVVAAIVAMKVRPKLYLPYGSVLHGKAENLLPLCFEAFIDRRYTNQGRLVSRDQRDAVINDPEEAWAQLIDIVLNNQLTSIDGSRIEIHADTFCIHGDHNNSLAILEFINKQMGINQIELS